MIVTFVSQCEKSALKRTRRVLDTFANRIGNNTWQTVITKEGLLAVHKLLRRSASKSTAVSCHWIRSRSRSDLLWVVGRRHAFAPDGTVPVNWTLRENLHDRWENNWHFLPLIRALTVFAALFHDWGKATKGFQNKLKRYQSTADCLRHEWVSCLLFFSLVQIHTKNFCNDTEWLTALSEENINENCMISFLSNSRAETPLSGLPPFAKMVAWLILTHHRFPIPQSQNSSTSKREYLNKFTDPLPDIEELFRSLKADFGYKNSNSEDEIQDWLSFDHGLMSDSRGWTKQIKKWANKTLKLQELIETCHKDNGVMRVVLFHARLALMLGDHNYSSSGTDQNWQSSTKLYANTDGRKLKQKLDEHLVGVSKRSLDIAQRLPQFESSMPIASNVGNLSRKSNKEFEWQDKAVSQIKSWYNENRNSLSPEHYCFFVVNIASTGKGKTFANAKIMHALSTDQCSLRYILALGLRTLTLQTADEYRNRLGLDDSQLGVLIGSRAIIDIHNESNSVNRAQTEEEQWGSESIEKLLDNEVYYEGENNTPSRGLETILTNEKNRGFLYAPVLACTIDHIMSATECVRGGKYILPSLRLMSSDLVIDEIDDFDVTDLKSIARLVHLAGMMGRKVMISSATIPPDLAKGMFHAYFQGWSIFAKTRNLKLEAGCAWVDEFNTEVKTVSRESDCERCFSLMHDKFIRSRIKKLNKQPVQRKAVIYNIMELDANSREDLDALETNYFSCVREAIEEMHSKHFILDKPSSKRVSFGVVRVANIKPCVRLSKFLLEADWPEDTQVKVMTYHSSQILLVRTEQEKHLDEILKQRKTTSPFESELIRKDLNELTCGNVIYILVATPVEEVGRDHDFDWAVVEPSSYRSIIQLAGRVLRHRNHVPNGPNIVLMNFNLKGYKQYCQQRIQKTPVFCRPGYESFTNLLDSHELKQIVEEQKVNKTINAIPRIFRSEKLIPTKKLADLEHHVLKECLNTIEQKGAGDLEGWISQLWWLTGIPQTLYGFRDSSPSENLYLVPNDETFSFCIKDNKGRHHEIEMEKQITHEPCNEHSDRTWLNPSYKALLTKIAQRQNMEILPAALIYGEISLTFYREDSSYIYSPQFGLYEK